MYCNSKCLVYLPLGDVFNVSCRQSFLYLSLMDSLPRWMLLYLPNQLRIFSYYFIVFQRLNQTDFLTLFTLVYLIHWSWFFGIVFISTILRTWGSPKQWWPEIGCEFLCASLNATLCGCHCFPLSPASGRESWGRGEIALWFLSWLAGQKTVDSQGFLPLKYQVYFKWSSSTRLWIF